MQQAQNLLLILLSYQEKKLVSTKLGACGPPTSLELAPSPVAPYDSGPTRYAHVVMN
jgi:hypothetical protein